MNNNGINNNYRSSNSAIISYLLTVFPDSRIIETFRNGQEVNFILDIATKDIESKLFDFFNYKPELIAARELFDRLKNLKAMIYG